MIAIQNALARGKKRPDGLLAQLDELAERVRVVVEADPSNPYSSASLSAEISDIRDRQKRILAAQDRERLSREARRRKEMLEHDAYAKGFEDGRQDALRREYTYSHDATREAFDAFGKAHVLLDAACLRLNDPELSEVAHQIALSALTLTRAADALYNQAVEMVTKRCPGGSDIPGGA